MNNYEHIMQGGIDALLDIFEHEYAGYSCGMCAFGDSSECTDGNFDDVCRTGSRRWLEAEYKGPDSWEKLLKDLDFAANNKDGTFAVHRYEKRTGKYMTSINKMTNDIASRIRALLEVE